MNVFMGVTVAALIILFKSNYNSRKQLNFIKATVEQQTEAIKKQKESTKNAFRQISSVLKNYNKLVRLVQRIKSDTDNEVHKITHDLDNLYNFNTKQVKTISNMMNKHNELVNEVFDQIRDVYCDLNDCDCSNCEYRERCIQGAEGISFSDMVDNKPTEEDDNSPIACKGENRMTIDPSSINAFKKLEKAMANSGVPKEVIDNYVTYIKNACKNYPKLVENKVVEVVWIFGDKPEAGVIKHKFIQNEEDSDKLINPNIKIVKTLDKLYNQKDN